MNKFLTIISFLILLMACSKENSEQFTAFTELNGETPLHFDAVFRKSDDGLFTLFLSKDSDLGPEHRLNFHNFEKKVGRTNLVVADSARNHNLPYASFSTLFYQRDVSLDYHHSFAYNNLISWIEIDKIRFRKIEGRFQVAMIVAIPDEDENPFFPYLTDTLVFTEGKFAAKRIF